MYTGLGIGVKTHKECGNHLLSGKRFIIGCLMLGWRFDIMISGRPCLIHYDGQTSEVQDTICCHMSLK